MICALCQKPEEKCRCHEDFDYVEPVDVKAARISLQEFWLTGKHEEEKRRRKLQEEHARNKKLEVINTSE